MAIFQVRAILPQVTLLPRDNVINTWTLIAEPGPALVSAYEKMISFYNDTNTEGAFSGKVCEFIGSQISRVANRCSFEVREINVAAGTLGDVLDVHTWTLGAAATTATSLPSELAVCTSFSGPSAGIPAASRRGRVFIGPINTAAIDNVSGEVYVNNLFRTVLAVSTKALQAALEEDDVLLAIWSRSQKHVTIATEGYVDNAWDIQRRRGVESTQRKLWTAP